MAVEVAHATCMRATGMSRLAVAAIGLALVQRAHAHPPTITVGGGAEAMGSTVRGVATVEASAASNNNPDDDRSAIAHQLAVTAAAQLHAGRDSEASFALAAHADLGFVLPERFLSLAGVRARLAANRIPDLASRRDGQRASLLAGEAGFGFSLGYRETPTMRWVLLRVGFGGAVMAQAERRYAAMTADVGLFTRCWLVAGQPREATCLDILDTAAVGYSGVRKVVVDNIDVVKLTGIGHGAIHGELGLRYVTNQSTLSVTEGNEQHELMTEDLPTITSLAPTAALAWRIAPWLASLRIEHTGYASLTGDMTLEDRASGELGYDHAGTKLLLIGFAARTRWWTSRDDPGQSAATGGATLALTTHFGGLEWSASLGVARSFYAQLDGGAADVPGLGWRSLVQVARSWAATSSPSRHRP